jgi:glycosyltransferase involved in cell wall biosynthesis
MSMGRFKIGIDISMVSERPAGIGRYASEVIDRLVNTPHEWVLFSSSSYLPDRWRRSNVVQVSAGWPFSRSRIVWSQTALPMAAYRAGLDLFWSPAHRLPLQLPASIPTAVTIHDLVWRHAPSTMRPLGRLLDATLMAPSVRRADCIITVSRHTEADLVREMPFARGRTFTIGLGVSSNLDAAYSDQPQSDAAVGEPYFLFVGTLEPRKNLRRLLEAYAGLCGDIRARARLVIVGGAGWGGVNVDELASAFGIADRIRRLGYVSDAELGALYQGALFLAMPSLYEGFGLPLLEAMTRGVPVMTSDCASMPEVAGSAGLLVNPHDVGSISNGLRTMICDDSARLRFAGHARVEASRFSWEEAARQTLQVFERVIQDRPGR